MTVPHFFKYLDGVLLLPEDVGPLSTIAVVKVSNKDSKSNGNITVKLMDHKEDFGLHENFLNRYFLGVQRHLNLSRYAQYDLKIVAEDQGKPGSHSSSYILHVKLVRSNGNGPRFTRKVYDVSIVDDVTPGEVIARMNATDKDYGENSKLTYKVTRVRIPDRNGSVEHLSKWFDIDNTAQVFVRVKLWCVFTPSFTVNIDIQDNGRKPRHGETVLNVTVKCSQHLHNFSVAENKPKGFEVGRISLTSAEPNKPLRVRLVTNITDFALNEKKGILTTTRMMDREVNSSYSLTAVLSDGSVEMGITLSIVVCDENDNSPLFVGMVGSHILNLSNPVVIGETIFEVQAIDRDSGSNGLVKYSIVAGNNRRVFHMNERNGKISLRKLLSEEAYTLIIRAADSGFIKKKAYLLLIISVKFITPAPPPFDLPGNVTPTMKADYGVIGIVVGALFGVLCVCLMAVFWLKFRYRNNREDFSAPLPPPPPNFT